ncbi:MAG: ribosome biogenesis GTPase Der [Syntrophobacteraceae bacterium]|nr:ribosome biogenesis GTPase Der [Syntrophobacteraceae bacterium]
MTVVAIIGRPNVGKSTLFNRIAGRRHALVDDFPGVTRDRNYAPVTWQGKTFTLIDTAGFLNSTASNLEEQARDQIFLAIEEADVLLFLADGKSGLLPDDGSLANLLRRSSKPSFFAVNKIDSPDKARLPAEFYELGLEKIYPISAAHGFGVADLLSELTKTIPETSEFLLSEPDPGEIRVAIVGRPNVGKSTLVNRLLGAPRVIVSPIPGTTRDAVDSPLQWRDQSYLLIDTAGIRRKGKTREKLEKISVLKSLQSIERSHVSLLMLDAAEGVTDQDLHVAGYIQEQFRACMVILNKWDRLASHPGERKRRLEEVRDRLKFMPFAPILAVSAHAGRNISKILPMTDEIFKQYSCRITTGMLNRTFDQILSRHEPPSVGNRRLKFYYATQASIRPPTFVLFCNQPDSVHFSYKRYLVNQFREIFQLDKTPIRLLFRDRKSGQHSTA